MSFLGIEIARRSLHGHQRALSTTAHNIANVNTPGYSRQEAVFQSTLAISYPSVNSPRPGQLGTGMTVSEIKRYRDTYLDRQVRDAKSVIGYNSSIENALQRVEAVLPEPTDFGIQALLGHFFNSWHTLAQDVNNAGAQAAVRGAAETLANSLTLAHHSLSIIRENLSDLFEQQVDKINSIGAQIAELNWEIAYQKTAGANPNDLLDRRDLLLEDLAKLADVTVEVADADLQTINVSVYGVDLVIGAEYDQRGNSFGFKDLRLDYADPDNPVERTIEEIKGIVSDQRHGELAGTAWAEARVGEYLGQLETLMQSLADAVNTALDGDQFFHYDAGTGTLSLGDDALDAISDITAEKAWEVAQLREHKVVVVNEGMPDEASYTLDNYYHHLVTGIGADIDTAQRGAANANAILGQISGLRESVSGVNLDEELTRMIQYQYGYQAAARVITVLDEILDTLINRML